MAVIDVEMKSMDEILPGRLFSMRNRHKFNLAKLTKKMPFGFSVAAAGMLIWLRWQWRFVCFARIGFKRAVHC
ncbi:hypothetical protein [Burkholderia thailandensis]|uniref:hypothetical protein n=1 Tax=Burkholderia thailandensis TaxID=57975 RepID=UPI0011867F88|nr:hypothetical protein [Burkholderia thailandensis]